MNAAELLPTLLGAAVLLPLVSFFIILVFGPRKDESGEAFAYVSVAAIGGSAILSFAALAVWLTYHWPGSHDAEPVAAVEPVSAVQTDDIAPRV